MNCSTYKFKNYLHYYLQMSESYKNTFNLKNILKIAEMFLKNTRNALYRSIRHYYTVKSERTNTKNDIGLEIHKQMKTTGPMTVATYMKQVLTHPLGGYYMHKDMFGAGGDFVTSPELSQVFGEMIAIWFLNEWSKLGSPKPLQLVEFGPGRGTLCQDLLRVFKHFGLEKDLCVQLIEVSPLLGDLQARKLCVRSVAMNDKEFPHYHEGVGFDGVPIKWYHSIKDVPKQFSLFLAHEFFDALPIHKFQKTDNGVMREVLIDVDPDKECGFRYILANTDTPIYKVFRHEMENMDHFEVCPDALTVMEQLAVRTKEDGGIGLIVDYGYSGIGKDSFRAFKKHKLHDPLVEPGSADLTADVDFGMLKKYAEKMSGVLVYGPTTQRNFLLQMGIEKRIELLRENMRDEQQKSNLDGNFHMLTDVDKMGDRFKFLSWFPGTVEKVLRRMPVAGFS